MTTKANAGFKFIGSSANDSIGTGEILSGYEAGTDAEGRVFLNISPEVTDHMQDWIEVLCLVQVLDNSDIHPVDFADILPNEDLG